MKRKYLHPALFILILFSVSLNKVKAQPKEAAPVDKAELTKMRVAIEQRPDDVELHEKYLKASGFTKWGVEEDPEFVKQYEEWMQKFPKSAVIHYAFGHAFAGRESPKAKKYLLKAVELDPKFDKAYYDLWIDGERWGDFKVSREYLRKAKEANPKSADYAFYYANGFSDSDPEKYKTLSFEVARNFPNTERGAQALYWLANRIPDPKFKISVYEQQRKEFPADKFNWTSSGMSEYYNLLLTLEPQKAVALAESLFALKENDPRHKKTWETNITIAKSIIDANTFLTLGKTKEAAAILDSVAVPRYGAAKDYILFLKSKTLDAAGKTQAAYQNMLLAFVKEPTEEMHNALTTYGKKIGKDANKVSDDIWYIRDTAAKLAPDFTMETYLTKGKSSLSDYKGKVVLITYWFPGCGPCRGEFPHFENVVKKFKGKDLVYLGINIVPDQDDYVVPFMKSSGYSFTPIKDHKDWVKGPLDNRNAAPVNFLIDQDGKIIFSRFRTDGSNEATLEMMIKSMLERKKGA